MLNINCLYWVPAKELRKIIIRLPALECLYAVDTKLGVTEQDCGLYSSIPRVVIWLIKLFLFYNTIIVVLAQKNCSESPGH